MNFTKDRLYESMCSNQFRIDTVWSSKGSSFSETKHIILSIALKKQKTWHIKKTKQKIFKTIIIFISLINPREYYNFLPDTLSVLWLANGVLVYGRCLNDLGLCGCLSPSLVILADAGGGRCFCMSSSSFLGTCC